MVIHIQTEVDDKTYKMLTRIASLKGKSLKEIVRDAISKYIEDNREELEKVTREDTIWKAVGVFEVESDASERDDWGCVDWQSE